MESSTCECVLRLLAHTWCVYCSAFDYLLDLAVEPCEPPLCSVGSHVHVHRLRGDVAVGKARKSLDETGVVEGVCDRSFVAQTRYLVLLIHAVFCFSNSEFNVRLAGCRK